MLALAFGLVFGLGKLLGGTGSDQPDQAVTASTAATDQSTSAAPMGPVAVPKRVTRSQSTAAPILAVPTGPCSDDEVTVLPAVPKAAAGRNIVIQLQLLGTQPACTFKVAPQTLVVKVTSGKDRIWSSQDCPKSIPATTVVVRSGTPVTVPVTWSGRRSDDKCSTATKWALPGFYHVFAAALGSTPSDVQFEVTLPDRRVVTRTAKPKPARSPSPGASGSKGPATQP